MAKIKTVLRTYNQKKDGTYPVHIRYYDGKTKYFDTGYSVKENQFKDGVIVRHPDSRLINKHIEIQRHKLFAKSVMNDISGAKEFITMDQAILKQMRHYENNMMAASFNRMGTVRTILNNAWGRDIRIDRITKDDVQEYISYRLKRGNGNNMIRKSLQTLAAILDFNEYEGTNYFRKAITAIKPVPVKKDRLTSEEIKLLENAELEGMHDIARDMFLFAFYCQGMRIENVSTINREDVGEKYITYRMNKGKKIREIEIHPKLRKIIDKYIKSDTPHLFPIVTKEFDVWNKKSVIDSATATINAHLKRIAIIAGINKKISTHISRHSYASIADEKGLSISVIRDSLGQSSSATTMAYLRSLSDDKINEEVRKVYE